MKKFILFLLVCFLLSGCALMEPVPSKVCPPPDGKYSFICEKSTELDQTPEQVYGWIFSSTAIAAITDVIKIREICDFKNTVDDWYVDIYPVTYDSVINKVVMEMKLIEDPMKMLLIKNIINQNLVLYSSPALIGEYDDWLLRQGSKKFDLDMMCR